MVGAAVLKFMDDNDMRFENTEVVAFFSGSEEAGLRGAKAFAKEHKKELEDIERQKQDYIDRIVEQEKAIFDAQEEQRAKNNED